MEIHFLKDVVVLLGLSVLVIFFFDRLKLPTILGFLLTGVVAGPHGLGLIDASHEVEILSEIGVILLLFIIGLEFSLSNLYAIRKLVFVGGLVQVFGTVGIVMLLVMLFGYTWQQSIFMGFLLSLSSTAIVLKILQEQSAINSLHGKAVLGILIFQDIIVVPMMLFTPLIAGASDNVVLSLLDLLVKALLVVVGVYVSARYIYPRLMYEVARTRNNELFILTVVVTCALVTWITSSIGLSLALGAFLAGLIISESEYSHQATSIIIPFREIFASFFFVSIGMLLDISFLTNHLFFILAIVLVVVLLKGLIAVFATVILRFPLYSSLMVGFALFQVGEFAFILSRTGIEYKLLDTQVYQYFLSVSILTMAVTPFVLLNADRLTKYLLRISPNIINKRGLFAGKDFANDLSLAEGDASTLEDHLIIVGYGTSGQHVVEAAKHTNVPYYIIEFNAETVKREAAKGEPIVYGDASQDVILDYVNIHTARAAVIAISDQEAAKLVTQNMRKMCKSVYIIVRVRFVTDVERFFKLGANEVISEEFESSIEIFTRVLSKYLLPKDEITQLVDKIRSDRYRILRPLEAINKVKDGLDIPNLRVSCISIQQENGEITGKTISEIGLRQNYGINLLAIQRKEDLITDVQFDSKILLDDLLYVLAEPQKIEQFEQKIKHKSPFYGKPNEKRVIQN